MVGVFWLPGVGFSLFYFFHSNRVLISEIMLGILPYLKKENIEKKKTPKRSVQPTFIYKVNKLVSKFTGMPAKKPAKFKARIPPLVLKISLNKKDCSFPNG